MEDDWDGMEKERGEWDEKKMRERERIGRTEEKSKRREERKNRREEYSIRYNSICIIIYNNNI